MQYVKAFHVLGAIMFFGSVLDHVSTSRVPGLTEDPETLLVVREVIGVSADYVTVPGLVLLLITGAVMVAVRRPSIPRVRWLGVHLVIALLITLNVALVLYPIGQDFVTVVSQAIAEGLPMDRILALVQGLQDAEMTFGPLNVLMALTTVFVAVVKPRFGKAEG
ncbi:DUF2269 family protein [Roseospira visakhapatnamensis]|uniref:DUF2269 family protein n=1 Tax=Roseospira visakhapatnamensis TaxID=390880 RepID=A0A7W6RGJ9_9PROT|nr:DUF2269 family protein [Roseospira visakhapatnamensis]MBB4267945.1 hypothetical protein [Roseospira visakhapatnamensis]